MTIFLNFLKGMAIGIANIIPGVSGGTMAVILGIYKKLTDSLSDIFASKTDRKKNIFFLLIIGFGAVAGIIIFARIFTFLFAEDVTKQATYFFFIGLIFGSIPFVMKLHSDMKFSFKRILILFSAIGLIILTALFGGEGGSSETLVVSDTWLGFLKITDINITYGLWLALCGILGAGSMVLPGFSGSALLISLGEYNNILYFVDQRMIVPLGFLAFGIIPGIVLFAKLISYLLKRFPPETYYFIIGLLLASNIQISLEIKDSFSLGAVSILSSLVTMAAGFGLAYFLSKINKS